jgi:integrase
MAARRSYGSGSISVRTDGRGRETFYGTWRANGRSVKRRLGVKRGVSGIGLTVRQAEDELRRCMREVVPSAAVGERLTLDQVSRHYVRDAERRGRKPSTRANIESDVRVHLAPFFRGKAIDAIRFEDVRDLLAVLEGKGLAAKSVRNIVATLSALCNYARAPQRRWVSSNPCDGN